MHPDFGQDPRNARLGLYVVFGQYGKSYSCGQLSKPIQPSARLPCA